MKLPVMLNATWKAMEARRDLYLSYMSVSATPMRKAYTIQISWPCSRPNSAQDIIMAAGGFNTLFSVPYITPLKNSSSAIGASTAAAMKCSMKVPPLLAVIESL